MRYLLDTDSVSYALRGHGRVGERILKHKPSQVCISSITLAELRYGADREGSRKLHRLIDAFIKSVDVERFGVSAATNFGRIGSLLAKRGSPIGQFDVLIAAHAQALKCTLVTNNTRHFERIPRLRLENWT